MTIAMLPHRPFRSTLALAGLVLPLGLLTGCPADDTPAETEGTTGTSTSGSSTDAGPGPDPDTTAASESSSSSTTAVADETTTTGEPGETETTDTTGGPFDGVCEGFEQVGNVATVLSRDGMPIDTTCDPTPAPCGGDPVGTWAIEATCGFEAFPNPLAEACPGSTFMIEVLGQSGTLTFEADGSFVQDFDIQAQVVITLDSMACFGIDCATFEQVAQGDNPGTTCQAMGPSCECTLPDDGMPEQAMGTWEVMGDDLILTTAEGAGGSAFCIGGDRLDLWQPIIGSTLTEVLCMDDQDCVDALGDAYEFYSCTLPE